MIYKINDWQLEISPELMTIIDNEYATKKILPKRENLFLAFEASSFANTKVVILGQDPYPNKSDAMGLAFSVKDGQKLPKSLANLFKELQSDLGIIRENGNLLDWAKQGVLLLNTTLIVEENNAGSHARYGLEEITKKAIELLNKKENVCFVLLGKHAQQFSSLVNAQNYVIKAPHPSPLSAYRGFFGSKIFSQINNHLQKTKQKPINWK